MNSALRHDSSLSPDAIREALAPLDFVSLRGGYERDGFRLLESAGWWTLLEPEDHPSGEPLGEIDQVGLWKAVVMGSRTRRVFAVPARVVASTDNEMFRLPDEEPLLTQILRWALATHSGEVDSGWTVPATEQVETWFRREQLTVVSGALLRQGEVIREPGQFTLRFPIVSPLPLELPEPRRAWLRALLVEAQDRWHLVRFGLLENADGPEAIAEVDLTGAPRALNPTLFVYSLEALRWAVQWLGEPADWLADVSVTSELLAVCPQPQPMKGAL